RVPRPTGRSPPRCATPATWPERAQRAARRCGATRSPVLSGRATRRRAPARAEPERGIRRSAAARGNPRGGSFVVRVAMATLRSIAVATATLGIPLPAQAPQLVAWSETAGPALLNALQQQP